MIKRRKKNGRFVYLLTQVMAGYKLYCERFKGLHAAINRTNYTWSLYTHIYVFITTPGSALTCLPLYRFLTLISVKISVLN